MRFSIAQKLVAAFLGLTLLVLAATLGLARWSFEQGFLDYVNALEQTRLQRLQGVLADQYLAADRNWQFMTEQRFAVLIRSSVPRQSLHRPPPGALPPPGRDGDGRPPAARRPGTQRPGGEGVPATALYDIDNNLVAGATAGIDGDLSIRVAIIAEGKTVGELRSEPRRQISSPLETEFSRQQLMTSWVLGISSLILALGVSLLLARGLLAPVRRMITSVAQLSSGDYSSRLEESRNDELGQLTRDLDRLGTTLQASQSSRKRLLADVSHELRTPLTILAGEIEALKDGLREFNLAQLESLDQEVQRLRYLVDDLYELSVSDVGGLRYQFATMDLGACLQQLIDGMRQRASAQGIELELVLPEDSSIAVTIAADAQRIDQLLQNLLENSLAYTDSPGRVSVTLSQAQGVARLVIEDTAPGPSQEDCEKLFDPLFRQEASRSRRTGGAGLGLAICRNIVAAHSGNIWASPSVQGGLCLGVEIPLAGVSST